MIHHSVWLSLREATPLLEKITEIKIGLPYLYKLFLDKKLDLYFYENKSVIRNSEHHQMLPRLDDSGAPIYHAINEIKNCSLTHKLLCISVIEAGYSFDNEKCNNAPIMLFRCSKPRRGRQRRYLNGYSLTPDNVFMRNDDIAKFKNDVNNGDLGGVRKTRPSKVVKKQDEREDDFHAWLKEFGDNEAVQCMTKDKVWVILHKKNPILFNANKDGFFKAQTLIRFNRGKRSKS